MKHWLKMGQRNKCDSSTDSFDVSWVFRNRNNGEETISAVMWDVWCQFFVPEGTQD